MQVLGVDQSLTCTGVAASAGDDFLTARVLTEPIDDSLRGTRDRIRYIVGRVLQIAPRRCLSVIEAPIVMRNGQGGAQLERAWLFGFLVDQLLLRGPVVQVRTTTRAMYATDNGRAEKPEVLAAMRARFPDRHIVDDNEADALALFAMGMRFQDAPVDGVSSKKQVAAMSAVHWPTREEMR